MGAFDKFEKGVENAIAGAFAKAFRSELKPVEIASAMKKNIDEEAVTLKRDRTIAPNVFSITLAPTDFDNIAQWGEEALIDELADNVTEYADEQDYVFVGPIRITFETNDSLKPGRVLVSSSTKRGATTPVTSRAASDRHPLVEIGSERYLLTGTTTIIGRGSDCDIIVDDTGISRHHLELRITPNGVIASDMGSTNGSFVEGNRITSATLLDGNTITIGRTTIMFWNAQAGA